MVNNCTLQHTLVNSGTAVILQNSKVNYGLKKIFKVPPIPGKYDIAEAEYSGFENPKITITGHFDVNDIDSNELTQELLTELFMLKSTTPLVLSVPTGTSASPTYLKGRPSGGYETDGDMTMQNTINVIITSISFGLSSSSDEGHFWNYNISLTESS